VDPDDLIGAEDGAEDLVEGDEEEAEA
jgi:hypothetical protein